MVDAMASSDVIIFPALDDAFHSIILDSADRPALADALRRLGNTM